MLPSDISLRSVHDMTETENKAIVLEIWAQDREDLIASFRWSGGETKITFAKEDFGMELQKLIDNGLSEWVGAQEDPKPRVTFSKDAFFLPHLGAYIRKQSGFRIKMEWEGRR